MSKELMISMLSAGKNGQQILNILDTITGDSVTNSTEDNSAGYNEPTSEFIDF